MNPLPAGPAPKTGTVVNVAAYRFAPLDRLPERRETLRELCRTHGLKGTILLSPEGINLFVAGTRVGVDALVHQLRSDPLLASLETKESLSDRQPFTRLLVKLKREIIAFGVEGIAPHVHTSRKLPAVQLKQWLDEGRPLTLLDTRNDYEVDLGTFANALLIGIDHFRDFPAAVGKLPAELKDQPIVMFCTGGIRCEKAGPFMEQQGFREIYQLDGGILKYFEKCGGAHYQGDCFVFDHRVALNPHLEETAATQCYACQHPLTPDDQQSDRYVRGSSCPSCWQPPADLPPLSLAEREAAIAVACDPLPGGIPTTNRRPLNVPGRYDGWQVLDFICDFHPHIGRDEWREIIAAGLVRDRDGALRADRVVRGGQRLDRLEPDTVEPAVNAAIRVIAWDDHHAVFDKPAPLPMHPCGRFNRNSMTHILTLAFPDEPLLPVHRLDSNTTGVVVFARSRLGVKAMQSQFERSAARKTYLCRVVGHPAWDATTSCQPISRAPAENGFRVVDVDRGDDAETVFRVRRRLTHGECLVEAMPRTGRTNQIRVHLWHLGHPVVGDPVYLPGGQLGQQQTLSPGDPPMCLHAWRLEFEHPDGRGRVSYETERPAWAE